MVSKLIGTFVRAILVALLIATPALILPGVGDDGQEISMVLALIGAIVIIVEYGSSSPGLVEFRYAPPFNRIRFLSLFFTLIALASICASQTTATELNLVIFQIGDAVGRATDFPLSPVRIIALLMSENKDHDAYILVRSAAGISYMVSLVMLGFFVIVLKALRWPFGNGAFNVWVNLPTLDWSSSSDIEERLARDGLVNIVLGFTFPFLVPLVFSSFSGFFDITNTNNHQAMIWIIAMWAFLPASLFMRGIALTRIARIIHKKRELMQRASVTSAAYA